MSTSAGKVPGILSFHTAKGGCGASVTAAATALIAAETQPSLLVDLGGDLSDILGVALSGPSLSDWFQLDEPAPDALARLEKPVSDNLSLLPLGARSCLSRPDRYRLLAQLLRAEQRKVVVDLGGHAQAAIAIVGVSDRSILVTRPCYLALRRAMLGPAPDAVILVSETGRALGASDVESTLQTEVVVTLKWDAAVARSVDAGLLACRLPRSLRKLDVLL